jgi:regulator of sirC expression with transglutaminase-like and TPR domain
MSSSPDKTKIASLIRLMDDRDESIRNSVKAQLVQMGEDSIPFLEIAARDEDLRKRSQAQIVLKEIFPIQLGSKFRRLSQKHGADLDLEEGICLLTQFGYPEFEPENSKSVLDNLADELAPRLLSHFKPIETVRELNKFLFQEKGFSGNEKNYFSGDNSFLNKILSNKTGIPISLSVLCILIGKRLNLPIVGVGMPCHFIAKYDVLSGPVYFDPFNKGRILSYRQCVELVEGFGLKFEDHFLTQSGNREILIRMINNLIMVYKQSNKEKQMDQLTQYVEILSKPNDNASSYR